MVKVSAQILANLILFMSVESQRDIDKSRTSKLALTNYNNEYYTVSIGLGEPAKPFEVKLDTTTPYFWVLSRKCHWSIACWLRKTYDSTKSTTYFAPENVSSEGVMIDFEGGRVKGIVSNDVLATNLMSVDIPFGEITAVKKGSIKFDGVLGLGLVNRTVKGQKLESALNRLVKQSPFRGFSLFLTRSNTKKNEGGELFIGEMNTDRFKLDTLFTHSLLPDTDSWTVKLDRIIVNDDLNWECDNCTVTFDIGTPRIKIPATILRVVRAFVSADSNGKFDCDAEFPTITFIVDGVKYTLDPWAHVYKKKRYLLETVCYDGFAESSSDKEWVFGANFLAQYYTAWDIEGRQIAIARLKN